MNLWQLDDGQHLASGGGNSNDSSLETGTKNGDSKVRLRMLDAVYNTRKLFDL